MPDSSTESSPLLSPSTRRNEIWLQIRDRLFPRGTNLIQWTSYIIILALTVLYVLNPPVGIGQVPFYTSITALSVLLIVNILWKDLETLFPQTLIADWALVLISTGLTFYVIGVGQMYNAVYALFMIAAQANAMLPARPALTLTALLGAGFLSLITWMGASMEAVTQTGLGLLVGMTFTATLMQVLNRYSEQTERANALLEQLRQANAELLAAREKEKELTIAEERVRVARDLHDGLGHHLTALSIQLQAAEKLVRANPEMAAQAVGNARGEVQAALKEVRQSVAALRETPVDIHHLPGAIERLVAETGQLSGLTARFEQSGATADLSAAAAMTVFRAVQEGLTNVQKHAQAARTVRVRLVYTAETVQVSIEDDGEGQPPCLDGTEGAQGGFGLAGLRERAALLGGRLECGPRPEGGFFVRLSLPVRGEEP